MNFESSEDAHDEEVIAELSSGDLTATVILVPDKVMKHNPGPRIWSTLDDTRVVVTFNRKAFEWRVRHIMTRFRERYPAESQEVIHELAEQEMRRAMVNVAEKALDDYFIVTGVAHLGVDATAD